MKQEMRTIITIDESLCTGCGLCVSACHEGAIALVGGTAKLMHEHYCDGLGDCLPACPTGAITFEERLASPYDEAAVLAAQAKTDDARRSAATNFGTVRTSQGCPSLRFDGAFSKKSAESTPLAVGCPGSAAKAIDSVATPSSTNADCPSQLRQWPVQIKLVSPSAPYFEGAHLLVAADCAAFAYGAFHHDFMAGKVTLIGCPKLDSIDYAEKLGLIISQNNIASVTVARMEVPCCGGIEQAAKNAIAASGKSTPLQVVTISTDGRVLPPR